MKTWKRKRLKVKGRVVKNVYDFVILELSEFFHSLLHNFLNVRLEEFVWRIMTKLLMIKQYFDHKLIRLSIKVYL